MTRRSDATFAVFAGLDPIGYERGTECLGRRAIAAESTVTADIARIVAVPRPDRIGERTTGRRRQPSGTEQTSRSRTGVLGLALSAAVAVAATLLWVSPSAGAPSHQANMPSRGVHHVAAPILPLR
jgi:hypothetical protein